MPLMRSPSPRCWPHEVTLTRNTWTEDADGGRKVGSTVTVRQVDCSVQPGEPEERIETSPDTGERRVTQVIPAEIIFPENPHLNVDDLATWIDYESSENGETHVYQVKGRMNAASLGSVFKVRTEERV